ncbi:hypothetical protein E2C01_073580 [Portunus trituberculatus]|uniref:Uncharacterized protein n=1 Tax=Portunus trituberculatus TaxID=210409 RepID=A0A5B7IDW1_PORTR|nr:hypothetical protein [Portunus trituberculatus]
MSLPNYCVRPHAIVDRHSTHRGDTHTTSPRHPGLGHMRLAHREGWPSTQAKHYAVPPRFVADVYFLFHLKGVWALPGGNGTCTGATRHKPRATPGPNKAVYFLALLLSASLASHLRYYGTFRSSITTNRRH